MPEHLLGGASPENGLGRGMDEALVDWGWSLDAQVWSVPSMLIKQVHPI